MMQLTAVCGVAVTRAVPKREVPQVYPDCPKCLATSPPVRWGDIRTMRVERGRLAHYVLPAAGVGG